MAKHVSANYCGNDRCYAEIRIAPVGAYKPTEKKIFHNSDSQANVIRALLRSVVGRSLTVRKSKPLISHWALLLRTGSEMNQQ